jgi:hypothetical protein
MAPWRRAGGAFLVSAIGLLLPIPAGPRPGMSTWGGGGTGHVGTQAVTLAAAGTR